MNRWCAVVVLVVVVSSTGSAVAGSPLGSIQKAPLTPDSELRFDRTPEGPVFVMVELEDPPTAQVFVRAGGNGGDAKVNAAATAAAKRHLSLLESKQQAVLARIEGAGISTSVLYRVQRVFNGIAMKVERDALEKLSQLPGVRSVRPLIPKERTNATSVPFIGAIEAWQHAAGLTGQGISIGIIDTGIDYIHADFGGSGTTEDYEANDSTILGDVPYPTAKVVGGWDFVGDDFAGTQGNLAPVPDPDPMDCNGHGTHVGGTAAGYGVNEDGSTYTGPWNDATPFEDMTIGPGVAPEAELYGLKVFGCTGNSPVVSQAVEWAVDPDGDGDFSDHLDVINLSLGSLYFSHLDDPDAIACDNAAQLGVIVAAAAGNASDNFFSTLTPAAADHVLSVAASLDDGLVYDGLTVNQPPEIAGEVVARLQSFGADPGEEGVTAEVVLANPPHACSNLVNAAEIAGKIALVNSSPVCTPQVKAVLARLAGAVGMIVMIDYWPGLPYDVGAGGTSQIPVIMVGSGDGVAIRDALPGVEVTMSSSLTRVWPELGDSIAAFSSRGPRLPDSQLKPDLAAPGFSVHSALVGSGSEGFDGFGTSMATPHAAGTAALLRQLHPDWSVRDIKALMMTTANHDLWTGPSGPVPLLGTGRSGSGRIDLGQSTVSEVVAFADEPDGLVSVSFGLVEVADTLSEERTVTVANHGTEAVSYDLSYDGTVDAPGVDFSLPGSASITVEAGGTASFSVVLDADAAAMRDAHDPSINLTPPISTPPTVTPLPRFWITEEAGLVLLTPRPPHTDQPTLRLPVHAVARPMASMAAAESRIIAAGDEASFELSLAGQQLDSGPVPPDIRSLVSAYELHEISPNEGTSGPTYDFADLAYIGVTSDYEARLALGEGLEQTVVQFGIVTHAKWVHPNPVAIVVEIDVDRDGEVDKLVFQDFREDYAEGLSDTTWSVVVDVPTEVWTWQYYLNGYTPDEKATATFFTNAMMLAVNTTDLDLSPADTGFDYRVVGYGLDLSSWSYVIVDTSDWHSFDPGNPGLHLTGTSTAPFLWDDLDGATIPVEYRREGFIANGSQGVLLIHHHNSDAERGQAIELLPVAAVDDAPRRGGGRVSP